MDRLDTAKLIIELNQFDQQVQANDAAVKFWHHSMAPLAYNEADEAVVQHYRANPGVKAEPGAILRRALQIRASRQAGQAAIEAGQRGPVTAPRTFKDYQGKIRNTPRFRELFEAGRREGNAERARATAAREGREDREAA